MAVRVGINGFGRIGRLIVRAVSEYDIDDIEIVAINSPGEVSTSAHLLRYDSVHGRFHHDVTQGHDGDNDWIDFGRGPVRVTRERDPANAAWDAVGADIILECSGVFRDRESTSAHLRAGAKAVLVSAPAKSMDKTIVYGVNENMLSADDVFISCASCTTNCLAPLAKTLLDTVGIKRGFMTTVHAYTQDQRILDNSHKDLYRARAAGQNMIPTSTGAAKAVGLVLPELNGKLSGSAVRVPTANVSMVDLAFQPDKDTTAQDLNDIFKSASMGPMKDIIRYTEEPLVSSDLNHDPHSAIFAAPLTKVLGGDLVKIIAWYDNEWGFANRMINVARQMHHVRS